ncbi:hypothetical protein L1987_79943 [Smallanthus sonchifolius]|uniref:Uncharacterized protein n=1 Tax=Smallanthus sonchifolius TaxID=185202 RepID=A0ACB8YLR2_9ASTR|nr:hypothetical protein L1987_79943 [Smallanthus sonchifolius]
MNIHSTGQWLKQVVRMLCSLRSPASNWFYSGSCSATEFIVKEEVATPPCNSIFLLPSPSPHKILVRSRWVDVCENS